jgi:uncharacterized protein
MIKRHSIDVDGQELVFDVNTGILFTEKPSKLENINYITKRKEYNFNPPKFVRLSICDDCNFTCTYCKMTDLRLSGNTRPLMSRKMIDKIVDYVYVNNNYWVNNQEANFISVIGSGEPFLHPETLIYISSKIKEYNPNDRLTVVTNGSLNNSELINGKYINTICVSMDGHGSINNEHRINLNNDAYDKSISLIGDIKKNIYDGVDIKFTIAAVLTPNIYNNFGVIAKHIQSLQPAHFSLAYTRLPISKCSPNYWNDMLVAYRGLADWFLEILLSRNIYWWFKFSDNLLKPMFRCMISGKSSRYKCKLYNQFYPIDSEGNIYPCTVFMSCPETAFGKLGDSPSKELLLNEITREVDSLQKCKVCWAKYICRGPCPYEAYINYGNYNGLPEEMCDCIRGVAEICMEIIYRLKKESPEIYNLYLSIFKIKDVHFI